MGGDRSRRIALMSAAVVMAAWVVLLAACDSQTSVEHEPRTSLRLAVSEECLCSLVFIAHEIDAFGANGLDVEIVPFPSSLLAYEALLTGDVDVATVADTPIAIAGSRETETDIIATIGRSDSDIKLVTNAARGSGSPLDVTGLRIGTREHTAAHFFLHAYLASQGIADSDVEIVFEDFSAVTEMLVAGELDAAAIRQPFVESVVDALAGDALVLETPGLYVKTMSLLVGSSVEPDTRRRILSALVAAEESIADSGCDEIAQVVVPWLPLDLEDLCDIICADDLSVRLDQSLVLQLEDQGRWALDHGLRDEGTTSDFLEMIDSEPLVTVDPARVRVIR